MDSFRRWGYLQTDLDPLGHFTPLAHPELDLAGEEADAARRIYCGSIGVEFAHISRSGMPSMDTGTHGVGEIAPRKLRAGA